MFDPNAAGQGAQAGAMFGPMGIGIGALAGGIMGGIGARKNYKRQRRYAMAASNMMQPGQIMGRAQQYNPGLYGAIQGGPMPTQPGYGQNMWNMANNPGYIDPRLMNMPMQQSARRMTNDFVEAQGRLGKTGMRGGLSQGYGLANLAARTQRDVNTQQQYSLWRENQRRADLAFISNQYNQLLGQSMAGQQAQAAPYMHMAGMQTPNGWTMGANAISGGLNAYSMMNNNNPGSGPFATSWGNSGYDQGYSDFDPNNFWYNPDRIAQGW